MIWKQVILTLSGLILLIIALNIALMVLRNHLDPAVYFVLVVSLFLGVLIFSARLLRGDSRGSDEDNKSKIIYKRERNYIAIGVDADEMTNELFLTFDNERYFKFRLDPDTDSFIPVE